MIDPDKLEHIRAYCEQQKRLGLPCKVPPDDLLELLHVYQAATSKPSVI